MSPSSKLWSGRFSHIKNNTHNSLMEKFNASLNFDHRLYAYDIEGSRAHAEMLQKIKILTKAEYQKILKGLNQVEKKFRSGKLQFHDAEEDIHTKVENELRQIIGDLAGKLHTGRSRNDQSNLDLRLYLRDRIDSLNQGIIDLMRAFFNQAKKHSHTILPGMTHLQPAQPITLSFYFLAYFFMLSRDHERFLQTRKTVNALPLGSGALAGVNYSNNREFLRQRLKFESIIENAMDAVSDRDHLLCFHSTAAITIMHLTRLAEELILFSNPQFGFVQVDENYATGSSIMPNKINPDSLELIRGKSGRIYGNLISLLTVMKSLPLAYNKDLQEDKEAIFDTVDQLGICLQVMTGVISTLTVFPKKMRVACEKGFLQATDVADYLVGKGLPFRKAHEISALIVRHLEKEGKTFEEMTLEEFQKFSPLFDKKIFPVLKLENLITRKKSPGSTSSNSVAQQILKAKKILAKI